MGLQNIKCKKKIAERINIGKRRKAVLDKSLEPANSPASLSNYSNSITCLDCYPVAPGTKLELFQRGGAATSFSSRTAILLPVVSLYWADRDTA